MTKFLSCLAIGTKSPPQPHIEPGSFREKRDKSHQIHLAIYIDPSKVIENKKNQLLIIVIQKRKMSKDFFFFFLLNSKIWKTCGLHNLIKRRELKTFIGGEPSIYNQVMTCYILGFVWCQVQGSSGHIYLFTLSPHELPKPIHNFNNLLLRCTWVKFGYLAHSHWCGNWARWNAIDSDPTST